MENVYFEFKGAYRENECVEIILERQGVTTTRNCAHPRFFAEIGQHFKGKWSAEVHYSNNSEIWGKNCGQVYKRIGDLPTENEAIEVIKEYASHLAEKPVIVNQETIHYCYGWQSYDYEQNDLFLSPVFYEEYTDTIRHYPSNYCLVAFNEGKFSAPVVDMDKAAVPYLPQIEKAINGGFHACDIQKGDDFCKRRLAWLTGCHIAKEHNSGRAIWCKLNMTKQRNTL